jgi:flagellar biosynthesis GTPase FlhF
MRAEDLEALREDMLALIAAKAFALHDTIGKSALDERVMAAIRQSAAARVRANRTSALNATRGDCIRLFTIPVAHP